MKLNIIEHLSVSQINQFLKCPLQWKFRKIDNLVIAPNAALLRGSAVHKGLEYIYKEKKLNQIYSVKTSQDIAEDYIKNEEVDNKDEIIDSGTKLINMYCKSGIPDKVENENIQGVEQYFEIKINDIKIIGYIDVLLFDKVIDFKTRNKRKVLQFSDKIQMEIYSKASGVHNTEFQDLIVEQKVKPSEVLIKPYLSSNEALVTNFITNIHESMQASIMNDVYMPGGLNSTWACDYCGYGEQGFCKYYKIK